MTTTAPAVGKTADDPSGLFRRDFAPEEFAARRARIFDAIGDGAAAVLQGAGPVRGFAVFRQSNEFYYCCGLEAPQAYLLLDGRSRRGTVYLPHREGKHSSEGATLAAEDAELIREVLGVDGVCGVESLPEHLGTFEVIYTPHAPAEGRVGCRDALTHADKLVAADPWDGRATRERHFLDLLHARLSGAELRDLSATLDTLRSVKSPREVALLRRAGELSARAVTEAMRVSRAGVREYQLGALASYIYLAGGAAGDGYRAIIASGANAWYSHYFRNNCSLADGDLVLMDTAPDYGYYTSDIGRMWPVNGTYSPVQRELYGFMVEYHKTLLRLIRPGVTAEEVTDQAAGEMAGVVERTRFSKPVYEAAARRTLTFRGHLSHPVGMAVHDVGGYYGKPMVEGMVFTIDPQMWVPEEKLYIRCEDTGAVTAEGMENLTAAAPLELDDVEAFLRDRRAELPLG